MRSLLCTSFLLGAALFVGCEKKPDQPKVDNTTTPPAVDAKAAAGNAADKAKSAAGDMADKTKATAGKAADNVSDATKGAVDATKDAGKSAADALKGNTPTTPTTPAVPDAAKAPAAGATDAVRTQASDLITKLSDAIKANRLNEAQTYIDKIESMKASLPADLQDQYVKLKSAYEKMKAGSTLLNK